MMALWEGDLDVQSSRMMMTVVLMVLSIFLFFGQGKADQEPMPSMKGRWKNVNVTT